MTAGGGTDPAAEGGAVRRTRRMPIRLSDAEHAALTAAAVRAGRRELATWARAVLLAAARGTPLTAERSVSTPDEPVEVCELRAAVRELVRVGVNLNQAARALNAPQGDDGKRWAAWLEAHAEAVEDHAEAVRKAAERVRGESAR